MLFVNNNLEYTDFLKIVKHIAPKLKILTGKSQPASLGPYWRQRQADLLISRPARSTQGVQTRKGFIAETVNQKVSFFGNSFDLLVVGSEVDCLDGNEGNI